MNRKFLSLASSESVGVLLPALNSPTDHRIIDIPDGDLISNNENLTTSQRLMNQLLTSPGRKLTNSTSMILDSSPPENPLDISVRSTYSTMDIDNNKSLKVKWVYKSIRKIGVNINLPDYLKILADEDIEHDSHENLSLKVINKYLDQAPSLASTHWTSQKLHSEMLNTLRGGLNNKEDDDEHNNKIGSVTSFDFVIGTEPSSPSKIVARNLLKELNNQDNCPIQILSPENIDCLVCFETLPSEQFYQVLVCGHLTCKGCIAAYILQNLNSNKIVGMKCPFENCNDHINESDISKLIPHAQYLQYLKLKKIQTINRDPTLRWCTKPGCEKYIKGSVEKPLLKCECGQQICFNCRETWHPERTCEEVVNEDFRALSEGREVKKCPKCGSRSEKDGGCDHVTCSCGYQWCWLCHNEYLPDHLKPESATRCPMLVWSLPPDFNHHRRPRNKCCRIFCRAMKCFCQTLMIIAYVILGLPVIVFALFFAGGLILHAFYKRDEVRRGKRKYNCGVSTLLFTIGFLLFPLVFITFGMVVLARKLKVSTPWMRDWIDQTGREFRKIGN